MIKSESILPIRIYDDVFDQQRFNFHCAKTQQFELIYPKNQLPLFQFKRTGSLALPTLFYLRNVCNDFHRDRGGNIDQSYSKEIPEAATNFSNYAATNFFQDFPVTQPYTDSFGNPIGTMTVSQFTCNGLSLIDDPGHGYLPHIRYPFFTILINNASGNYQFKIIVERFVRIAGSAMSLKIKNGGTGGTVIGTITAPGIYYFDFTSSANDITVEYNNYKFGDQCEISYVQATFDYYSTPATNDVADVTLNEMRLRAICMGDGTDTVFYCEPNQNYDVPPGNYYYVIADGNNYYFSEVFKVVSLLEIQKYYKLFWRNSCDINSKILFSANNTNCNTSDFTCDFNNVLYLDAALFKLEPETKEEDVEDGNGEQTSILKTWKKNINFEIPKCPEFITDALSAVFIHDTITITRPLNISQENQNSEVPVKKIIPTVTSILLDCFQKVNLKLLIDEVFINKDCCNNEALCYCEPQKYNAASDCSTGYKLTLSSPPDVHDGLLDCENNVLLDPEPTDLIYFGGKYYTLVYGGSPAVWTANTIAPSVTNVTTSAPNYVITGQVIPNSIAVIQYQKNGGAWTTVTTNVISDSTGYFTINIPTSLASGASSFKVRVKSQTITCDFGTSDAYIII